MAPLVGGAIIYVIFLQGRPCYTRCFTTDEANCVLPEPPMPPGSSLM